MEPSECIGAPRMMIDHIRLEMAAIDALPFAIRSMIAEHEIWQTTEVLFHYQHFGEGYVLSRMRANLAKRSCDTAFP